MLSFCKNLTLLHYFLGFPISSSDQDQNSDSGLSLISSNCQRPDNVLESAFLRSAAKGNMEANDDDKKMCEIFSNGGFVGNTCTESLGFESSDQMELEGDEEDEKKIMVEDLLSTSILNERHIRSLDRYRRKPSSDKLGEDDLLKSKKKKLVFPPPLSTMNQENGKPNSFLKPVRKDGKLELIQVHIIHPKPIFQASRQDGRLRLYFIDKKVDEENEEIKEEEQVIETKEIKDEGSHSSSIRIKELKFPLMGTNEGFMRSCHELIANHHHHHMNRSTVHVL
ncbi:protein FANTASTIC FOUR 1-like [Papaver somniferum]|uniref:protein FANTASTIC FOUR 1-like n=1 Tax=Papaver somniferum TaxID=3469 RepID=UPI000E7031E7|nr:protein FANTASTIC FOUR 1-like [Papaver somniferum]